MRGNTGQDVIEGPVIHAYSWEWTDTAGPRGRSRLPWFGIFLVVFGLLLLLETVLPSLKTMGSVLFLAVGIAFLVSWAVNRGMGSLYLGSIITALAAPDLSGLAALTHTPSPMRFLGELLDRPQNEKAFAVIPAGYPADDCVVPNLVRKSIDQVLIRR